MMLLFYKNRKGFSLLEMLAAIGVFSFMVVFVSQALKQNHRQTKKIQGDIKFKSSLSYVLDLIRKDFQGVSYFLDINENLQLYFPTEKEKKQGLESSSTFDNKGSSNGNAAPKDEFNSFQVRLSPYFTFEGDKESIRFISYSFSSSQRVKSFAEWLKIHYYIEPCNDFKGHSSTCLIRATGRHWNPQGEEELEKRLVLLRGLSSLSFSYSLIYDPPEWKDHWKPDFIFYIDAPFNYPVGLFSPALLKLEIEQGGKKKKFIFPISQVYLKAWNPHSRAYNRFPKWKPHKTNKDKKKK